jgi:hypothetical protein
MDIQQEKQSARCAEGREAALPTNQTTFIPGVALCNKSRFV